MITKERLEELIKNNGKIYHIIEFNGECAVEKNKIVDFNAVDLLYSLMNGDKNEWFETKEDAEFALKYRNITRTETLNLPTWEEISDGGEYRYIFTTPNSRRILLYIYVDGLKDNILIDDTTYGGKEYFDKKTTKANYLSACELCRKLFLGEEE